MLQDNLQKNGSGCTDPTAYEAITNVEKECRDGKSEYARFYKLIKAILNICDLCGFAVEERIVLRDKKTGRIWR